MATDPQAGDSSVSTQAMRSALKSQYHASLAMLRETISECPDDLWTDSSPLNAFWQVAYHALMFTHLYLQTNLDDFERWAGHQGNVQHEDGLTAPGDPQSDLPLLPRPYSKDEVLAYWQLCDDIVDPCIDAMELGSQESGFHWYRMPKLEHQLVNLRHLAHHTGQLADRLRAASGKGTRWVGARRP